MKGENWKWWYFVVAGVLIVAYACYEFYELKIGKGIGSVILGVFCIVVGIFSRKAESAPAEPTATEDQSKSEQEPTQS